MHTCLSVRIDGIRGKICVRREEGIGFVNKIDFFIGVFLIVFASAYFYETFQFLSSGAALVPRIYAVILIVFSLLLIVRSFFTKQRYESGNIKRIVIAMAMFFIYIVTIPWLGFYLSSSLFILALLLFRKVKNVYILVGVPVGSSVFIYLFFQKALNVPVPLGLFS